MKTNIITKKQEGYFNAFDFVGLTLSFSSITIAISIILIFTDNLDIPVLILSVLATIALQVLSNLVYYFSLYTHSVYSACDVISDKRKKRQVQILTFLALLPKAKIRTLIYVFLVAFILCFGYLSWLVFKANKIHAFYIFVGIGILSLTLVMNFNLTKSSFRNHWLGDLTILLLYTLFVESVIYLQLQTFYIVTLLPALACGFLGVASDNLRHLYFDNFINQVSEKAVSACQLKAKTKTSISAAEDNTEEKNTLDNSATKVVLEEPAFNSKSNSKHPEGQYFAYNYQSFYKPSYKMNKETEENKTEQADAIPLANSKVEAEKDVNAKESSAQKSSETSSEESVVCPKDNCATTSEAFSILSVRNTYFYQNILVICAFSLLLIFTVSVAGARNLNNYYYLISFFAFSYHLYDISVYHDRSNIKWQRSFFMISYLFLAALVYISFYDIRVIAS